MTPQTEAQLIAALHQISANLVQINNRLGHISQSLTAVASKVGR